MAASLPARQPGLHTHPLECVAPTHLDVVGRWHAVDSHGSGQDASQPRTLQGAAGRAAGGGACRAVLGAERASKLASAGAEAGVGGEHKAQAARGLCGGLDYDARPRLATGRERDACVVQLQRRGRVGWRVGEPVKAHLVCRDAVPPRQAPWIKCMHACACCQRQASARAQTLRAHRRSRGRVRAEQHVASTRAPAWVGIHLWAGSGRGPEISGSTAIQV